MPRKKNLKINSEKSEQKHYNFQLNLNKLAQAQYVNILHAQQNDASFPFLWR